MYLGSHHCFILILSGDPSGPQQRETWEHCRVKLLTSLFILWLCKHLQGFVWSLSSVLLKTVHSCIGAKKKQRQACTRFTLLDMLTKLVNKKKCISITITTETIHVIWLVGFMSADVGIFLLISFMLLFTSFGDEERGFHAYF